MSSIPRILKPERRPVWGFGREPGRGWRGGTAPACTGAASGYVKHTTNDKTEPFLRSLGHEDSELDGSALTVQAQESEPASVSEQCTPKPQSTGQQTGVAQGHHPPATCRSDGIPSSRKLPCVLLYKNPTARNAAAMALRPPCPVGPEARLHRSIRRDRVPHGDLQASKLRNFTSTSTLVTALGETVRHSGSRWPPEIGSTQQPLQHLHNHTDGLAKELKPSLEAGRYCKTS